MGEAEERVLEPGSRAPLGLTPAELQHFHERGWVHKRGVIGKRAIAAVASAINAQVDAEVGELVRLDKLDRGATYPDAPFESRLGLVAHACRDVPAPLNGTMSLCLATHLALHSCIKKRGFFVGAGGRQSPPD